MAEEIADEPTQDVVLPTAPLTLMDWSELYPSLPLRTVALSLWEANRTAWAHPTAEDRDAVIVRLVTARLEQFSARRRGDDAAGSTMS